MITAPALKNLQPRTVAAIGSALSGFGLILSSMSNQLWQIIVAYGLVGKTTNFITSLSLSLFFLKLKSKNSRMFHFVDVLILQALDWDS